METTTHWSSIGVRIFPEVGVMRERERERERERGGERGGDIFYLAILALIL